MGLALVFSAGDDFGEVDGEALGFGEGEAVFSVVTETLVSEGDAVGFSDAVASGEGLDSSWAWLMGTAAKTTAVRARMIVFICVFLFLRAEGHPIGVREARSSHLTKANSAIQFPPLASRVLLSS